MRLNSLERIPDRKPQAMITNNNQPIKKEKVHYFIKFPLYILSFILLCLIFGYFTFKVISFARTVEVPDLHGKNVQEANKLLVERGLYLKIEDENHDSTVPKGHVIRQEIQPGNMVKERSIIKIVISKGPQAMSIPLIVNETLNHAEYLLRQKGLKISKIIPVHSDTIERDHIIAQKPEPHERIGDHITVLVSRGPYDKIYYCPDFKGMYLDHAKTLALKLNLKLSIEGKGDKVEKQRPLPYILIKSGDTIYLKVYEETFPENIAPLLES